MARKQNWVTTVNRNKSSSQLPVHNSQVLFLPEFAVTVLIVLRNGSKRVYLWDENCAVFFLFFNGPSDILVYQQELFDLLIKMPGIISAQ